MNKKKKQTATTLAVVVALFLGGGGEVLAKAADTSFLKKPIDPAKGETYNHRQKVQHDVRKAAALRLKAKFQEVQVQYLARQMKGKGGAK